MSKMNRRRSKTVVTEPLAIGEYDGTTWAAEHGVVSCEVDRRNERSESERTERSTHVELPAITLNEEV